MDSSSIGGKGSQGKPSLLADELIRLGYYELFQTSDESALDRIWNEPGAPEALATLAVAPDAPTPARFLAAEMLFYKKEQYPPEEQKRPLASVYAAALAQNYTGVANPWGLPGFFGGLVAEHVVTLSGDAIPELIVLLDDDRRLNYTGSQEATVGNCFEYRVKDAAAFFISQIKALPFEVHQSRQVRDKEIERLKDLLK